MDKVKDETAFVRTIRKDHFWEDKDIKLGMVNQMIAITLKDLAPTMNVQVRFAQESKRALAEAVECYLLTIYQQRFEDGI